MLPRTHTFLDYVVLKYIIILLLLLLLLCFYITSGLKIPYKQHKNKKQAKPKCLCLSYLGNKCRQVRMFWHSLRQRHHFPFHFLHLKYVGSEDSWLLRLWDHINKLGLWNKDLNRKKARRQYEQRQKSKNWRGNKPMLHCHIWQLCIECEEDWMQQKMGLNRRLNVQK